MAACRRLSPCSSALMLGLLVPATSCQCAGVWNLSCQPRRLRGHCSVHDPAPLGRYSAECSGRFVLQDATCVLCTNMQGSLSTWGPGGHPLRVPTPWWGTFPSFNRPLGRILRELRCTLGSPLLPRMAQSSEHTVRSLLSSSSCPCRLGCCQGRIGPPIMSLQKPTPAEGAMAWLGFAHGSCLCGLHEVLSVLSPRWRQSCRALLRPSLQIMLQRGTRDTPISMGAERQRAEAKHKQTQATQDTPTRDRLQTHPLRSAKTTVQQATAGNLRPTRPRDKRGRATGPSRTPDQGHTSQTGPKTRCRGIWRRRAPGAPPR
jgi:hypothetical protein